MTREVVLYTRRDCGLCDEAADALRRLGGELDFTLIERDIDEDAGMRARFDDVVPVVEAGGRIVARAPFDVRSLRAALIDALG